MTAVLAAVVAWVIGASGDVAGAAAPRDGAHRLSAPRPAIATGRPLRVGLKAVATLPDTTALATRPGDPTRLYVTTQPGQIVALRDGEAPVTVLDLRDDVRAGGERGLLGLAFSPDGTRLYVHYTGRAAGETVLEEYTLVGDRIDESTRRVLLTLPQPQPNHNGGQLAFGPDGHLYLALGDGGGRDDRGPGHAPEGNGQSLGTLLGKILRIDPRPSGGLPYSIPPDNPFADGTGRPEIYVYGLRNPWRFSFDVKTGDLWIADVGQDEWEEVTRLPAGRIAGANLGWNLYEGSHPYRPGPPVAVVMPLIETSHADGNCSIIGGYVYRGKEIRALRDWYVFTDYCNGRLRALKVASYGGVRERDLGIELPAVSSFGVDTRGELYVLSQDRGVFRVVPR